MKTNKFRLQHKLGAIQPTMNNSRNEYRTKTHVSCIIFDQRHKLLIFSLLIVLKKLTSHLETANLCVIFSVTGDLLQTPASASNGTHNQRVRQSLMDQCGCYPT